MNYADIQYTLVPVDQTELAICTGTAGNYIARIVVQPTSTTVEAFTIQDGATATETTSEQHQTIITGAASTEQSLQPYVLEMGIGPNAQPPEGRGIFITCGAGQTFTVVGMLN